MSKKTKYELEVPIHASPSMLYQYISTASGLSEWYAENVNFRGKTFIFFWDGSEERAVLVNKKRDKHIRFQWESDRGTDYYFQITIQVDEITKDVSLIITDFSEADELEESKQLWENAIDELKHLIGSV